MTSEKMPDDSGVLDDVFSSGRDRGADPAASVEPTPQAEVQPPASAEQDAPKAEGEEPKPKGYRDPDTGRFVPLDELKSEREKRQEAQKRADEEARLRTQAEENARRYQAMIEDMQRRATAAQNPPPPPPDPFTDPEGALTHVQQTFQQQLRIQAENFSEMRARDKFGDEAVEAAKKAAVETGVIRHFANSPRPETVWQDLVQWHKKHEAMKEIGDDPNAYKAKLAEQIRQQVLAELQQGKVTPGAPPQAQPRFPGSLIDSTSSGPQGAQPVTSEAVMASIFDSGRKRK
jgi:hypothetical protein